VVDGGFVQVGFYPGFFRWGYVWGSLQSGYVRCSSPQGTVNREHPRLVLIRRSALSYKHNIKRNSYEIVFLKINIFKICPFNSDISYARLWCSIW